MVFSSIIQQQLLQQQQQQSQEFLREKKLDLNAPLMSIRRHHLEASSSDDEQIQQQQQQSHHQHQLLQQQQQRWGLMNRRSEFCDSPQVSKEDDEDEGACWGSLRSPGAVPFVWERTPGRPKFEPPAANTDFAAAARNSCSSPSLPPGRTAITWTPARPATTDSYRHHRHHHHHHHHHQQEQQRKHSVADVKAQPLRQSRQRKKSPPPPPDLRKDSPPRGKQRQQLGDLFKSKGVPSSTCESDEQLVQVDDALSSDARQSESLTLDPPAYRKSPTNLSSDDPAARDFILRRFLPAAKAMADESASSTPFASPLVSSFSPKPRGNNSQQANLAKLSSPHSTSSPRNQVAASVERIQTYQYKFASSIPRSSDKAAAAAAVTTTTTTEHDDFFALKACGFFSFALRHLRPQYPSSRLRRCSDRARNRFATDDFHTSIFVKKVNGGLTIRHESEASETETEDDRKCPRPKQKHQPRKAAATKLDSPRKLPPKSHETFYDCDSTFGNKPPVSPQKPENSSYYRGSVSPLHEAKGFLGLPENYKPPEDPYRNDGFSPWVVDRNSNQRRVTELVVPATLAKRLETNLLVTADKNAATSPSPGWLLNHQETSKAAVANGETSPARKKEVHWSRPPSTHSGFDRPATLELPLQSPARNNGSNSPTGGTSPLLPPKSPSHSWLWKALPQSPSVEQKNAKWEATVKSRKLRPGHLRYSEENALQPCEYEERVLVDT